MARRPGGIFVEELIVLGTGNALATRCYNTCFAVRADGEALLVDAGGGNGILRQLQQAALSPTCIHHLVVTHEHCDHLLGVVWLVRKIGTLMLGGGYPGQLTIYCHPGLEQAIRGICGYTLEQKFTALLGQRILFAPVVDGAQYNILGRPAVFFDIRSTKALQYGFCWQLQNGPLVCLGDEPYNPACAPYVQGCRWLLCEAFCLYGDRERFKPYQKHHSTVKDAAQLAQQLGAAHLVLWHTEDETYDTRKARYTAEARRYYTGDVRVPYDLEVLPLD